MSEAKTPIGKLKQQENRLLKQRLWAENELRSAKRKVTQREISLRKTELSLERIQLEIEGLENGEESEG